MSTQSVADYRNRSLSTGCFPSEFKQAIVRPLLKESGLDADDPKNYAVSQKDTLLMSITSRTIDWSSIFFHW